MTTTPFAQQAEFFGNRLRKNFKHLRRIMARESIEAFRLFDRDIPELRLVLDWYAGHAVLAEYVRDQTAGTGFLAAMADAAALALAIPRDRVHTKERRTGARGHRYARLAQVGQRLEVRERDLVFLCNLTDFIDTGLYADHRITRQLLRQEAAGKDFLNLFAYTGAFTVAAAKGGARCSVSVDTSQPYLDWGRDNLAANGLASDAHTAAAIDVGAWLEWARRSPQRFDLAVVDPPSFSQNRSTGVDFDVQRDHPALLAAVAAVLRPGGVLFFSTNHQRFVPQFGGLQLDVRDLTAETLPIDFRNARVHGCWRLQLPG